MSDTPYTPPKVWTWDKASGGQFANINRPIAGPTHDKDLPVGEHDSTADRNIVHRQGDGTVGSGVLTGRGFADAASGGSQARCSAARSEKNTAR